MGKNNVSEIPGDILKPFIAFIVLVDKRHFDKFIQADEKIYSHRRELQQKGADKAQRDGEQPHINKIT